MTALLCAAAARPAAAQDGPFASEPAAANPGGGDIDMLFDLISPVVTTATKDSRRVEEAPSVITVLTQQNLRDWGYVSVGDALRHAVGLYLQEDHVLGNLAVRGTSAGYRGESSVIKVLINGSPVSFHSTSGSWLGPEMIPLSIVDHIEVIRGPVSALYGADAFLGVVNIITRTEASDNATITVGANQRTSNGALGTDVDAGLMSKHDAWSVSLAARLQTEDRGGLTQPASSPAPMRPSYAPNRRTAGSATQTSRTAFGRLSYAFSPDTSLAVTAYVSQAQRIDEYAGLVQLLGGIDAQSRQSYNLVTPLQGYASAQLRSQLTPTLSLDVLLTYFAGTNTPDNRTEVGSDTYYVRRDIGFQGGDARVEARWEVLPPLVLTAGLEGVYDFESLNNTLIAKQPLRGVAAGGILTGLSSHLEPHGLYNPAAYLQAVWTAHPQYLTVALGGRYDYHNLYRSQPSARLGLVSQPFENTYFKLLYGTAFKAPSPLLLYSIPAHAGDIVGNGSLLPQRVHTFEFEGTYRFTPNISLSSGVAFSLIQDQAAFVAAGLYQVADNVGAARSISWESRLRVVYPNNVEGYASFELQNTQRDARAGTTSIVGSDNIIYPPIQAHVGAIKWFRPLPLKAMVEASYVARRRSTDQNAVAHAGKPYSLPDYVEMGAGVSTADLNVWQNKATEVSLTARNLLMSRAADPGFDGVDYPRLPLTVFLSLRQEL